MRIRSVMPGLVPGIHVLLSVIGKKTWMAGTSPARTTYCLVIQIGAAATRRFKTAEAMDPSTNTRTRLRRPE
jgi:hypothetical protein